MVSYSSFAFGLIIMMMNLWDTSTSSSGDQISSSAQEIGEDEDLLTQIFIHLPVKSLLRFKSVSKKWKNLISTSYFSIIHTRTNPNLISSSLLMLKNHTLFLVYLGNSNDQSTGYRFPILNFFDTIPGSIMRILGLCNGLMLSHMTTPPTLHRENDQSAYYVSNITTRRYIKLPPPGKIMNKENFGLILAFNPSNSPHFKIICAGQSSIQDDWSCQIEIFSSETGSWKLWNGSFARPCRIQPVFERGVFCNDAIHCLCPEGDSFYFVVKDETIKTMQLPPLYADTYTTARLRFLGQSGGYLLLIDIEENLFHNPPMEIFEMGKDYSGWTLKYRVDFDYIGSVFPEMVREIMVNNLQSEDAESVTILSKCFYCSVLSVRQAADGEGVEIVISIPYKLISYSTKMNTMKVLLNFDQTIHVHDFKWYGVHPFIETLTWL